VWLESGPKFERHRFTGKPIYGETGLYHFGARDYHASYSRWTSVDPVMGDPTNPQRLNRYAYVLNDPVNYVDPDGTNEEPPCLGRPGDPCPPGYGDDPPPVDTSFWWDWFLYYHRTYGSRPLAMFEDDPPGISGDLLRSFLSPVRGNCVISGWVGESRRGSRGSRPHGGVDISTNPYWDSRYSGFGTTVFSMAPGTVVDVDQYSSGENYVQVKLDYHDIWVTYVHITSELKKGDKVWFFTQIGKTDNSGNVSQPHVHLFFAKAPGHRQEDRIDPEPYLPENCSRKKR
jgi:RHS repeat-associated protein